MPWLIILQALAISLITTLVLELAFSLLWGVRGKDLILVCLVNVLTNPIVVFCYYWVRLQTNWNYHWVTFFLELSAVIVEWQIYTRTENRIRRQFLFSLFANLFSYEVSNLYSRLLS